MLKKYPFYIIYICLPVLIFCSSGEKTYTVDVIYGVNFVHNQSPVYDGDSKISLELVRQIGEYDAADENLQFNRPSDIDFDDDGNI